SLKPLEDGEIFEEKGFKGQSFLREFNNEEEMRGVGQGNVGVGSAIKVDKLTQALGDAPLQFGTQLPKPLRRTMLDLPMEATMKQPSQGAMPDRLLSV
ncbi:unnamed protein product, partial [Ilex paraguariensis]